ncbi:MAG: MerR family DNA-binding protein [Anaerolineaceae bacterium]|nr:MAG: MerR family DNA-binding protein [Anaerolineaceae bacterium]
MLVARPADPRLENKQATIHAGDRYDTFLTEVGIVAPGATLEGCVVVLGVNVKVSDFGELTGARSLDFSLDDIQEILALREQREAPCRVVLDLLEERAVEINRRIAELQRMEAELRDLYRLGQTFPTDDVDGKNCVCHLVSEHSKTTVS